MNGKVYIISAVISAVVSLMFSNLNSFFIKPSIKKAIEDWKVKKELTPLSDAIKLIFFQGRLGVESNERGEVVAIIHEQTGIRMGNDWTAQYASVRQYALLAKELEKEGYLERYSESGHVYFRHTEKSNEEYRKLVKEAFSMPSWLDPRIEIRKSSWKKGDGMFAKASIQVGEKLVEWHETYIKKEEAETERQHGRLVMQWDDDLFSVEDRGDDPGYFINHSCDSNTWMIGPNVLVARKNIESKEEITADYALWESNESYVADWRCKCGSALCRKRITGKDWMMQDVQERYHGHFSPLVNKRIEAKKH